MFPQPRGSRTARENPAGMAIHPRPRQILLSLCLQAGSGFQKAGVVSGSGLSFSWKGERFDLLSRVQLTEPIGNWNLYVLSAALPSTDVGQGFAYGELNSMKEFLFLAQ